MKRFSHEIAAHRKTVLIFLLAILFPSLIVGYLSISTVLKRREAVKNLLESNLWLSGEAALQSLETTILDYEKDALNRENFTTLSQGGNEASAGGDSSGFNPDIQERLFLLDSEYHMIFPKSGFQTSQQVVRDAAPEDTPFLRTFQKAESEEFSKQDASGAAELYQSCVSLAATRQQKALALEGLGRCRISLKQYTGARRTYSELADHYSHVRNKAGHPYGIAAGLQLADIEHIQRQNTKRVNRLFGIYNGIRNGVWLLNSGMYDFFSSEIETVLNTQLRQKIYPDLFMAYDALKHHPALYKSQLAFFEFMAKDAIPFIKEKIAISRRVGPGDTGRELISTGNEFRLISYTILPEFRSGDSFYGGFIWNVDFLLNKLIPDILEDMTQESGLRFQIVPDNEKKSIQADGDPVNQSRLFAFRKIPLPWQLSISQPEMKTVEITAQREMFLYGGLLIVIILLMALGVFLIVRDISRESETNRLKTEFVHNISHELKTPLTLIRLYGETLQRKKNLSSKEKSESYEIITKESERLSHMVNNVLDFSRIEMGRKEFHMKKGKITDVIRNTLESYQYHLEKKGFIVYSDIATDFSEMSFDPEALASVLVNLLSNAIKFSPDKKEVQIKLYQQDDHVVLQVTDQGIGIGQKDRTRIFQRFYRAQNQTVSETSGSGLGLPLVKHIVEAHGGQINVESEVGKGSTFSVILPLSVHKD